MADSARKHKLATAKKKLKNYRKGSKGQPSATSSRTNLIENDDPEMPSTSTPKSHSSNHSIDTESTDQHNNHSTNDNAPVTDIQNGGQDFAITDQHNNHSTNDNAAVTDIQNGGQDVVITDQHNNHSTTDNAAVTDIQNGGQDFAIRSCESTERIQQLSHQMNGLLSETSAFTTDGVNNLGVEELEIRNQKLAETVQRQSQDNEQLTKELDELKQKNTELEMTIESDKECFEEKVQRELRSLKEQMQVHIQTIGILVAEKTELTAKLHNCYRLLDNHAGEVQELIGRLRAARDHVGDVERAFGGLKKAYDKNEESIKEYVKDIDRLKLEVYTLGKTKEEHVQQSSELEGKLKEKVGECAKLNDELIKTRGKLEMSDLRVQQYENSTALTQDVNMIMQIETLLKEKSQHQTEIHKFREQFECVTRERDHISQQYQEYIEQLQQQLQTQQAELTAIAEERDGFLIKTQELEKAHEELQLHHDSQKASASQIAMARLELASKVETMVMQVGELKHKYETQVADNSQLSRLVMEREENVQELELQINQLADNQIDKEKLLESIQSDKTALSRAMAQNKTLKEQHAELQEAFIQMSNDNMELLNKYQSEQHVCKELGAILGQQEEELKDVRQQHIEKEKLLLEVVRYAEVLDVPDEFSGERPGRIEEKMKEFRQLTPLIETLQKELISAQDNINALTNQNAELRSEQLQTSSTDNNMNASSEQVETLTASIRQLEMERNQIVNILQEEKQQRQEFQDDLKNLREKLANSTPATLNGDVINKTQFEVLQHAMKQLEVKYTKTMRDKADLTDQAEQLEHTILQLQGETDTIAEYITLYQTQRMLLRQRQEEKDDYIARLAREREEQGVKLSELQTLLVQVLAERKIMKSNRNVITTMPNHVPLPGIAMRQPDKMAGNLDSTHLEDWPDYTSSDSDVSDVETVIGVEDKVDDNAIMPHSTPSQDELNDEAQWNITKSPVADPMAVQIMHLLSEIGSSVYVDPTDGTTEAIVQCSCCKGDPSRL